MTWQTTKQDFYAEVKEKSKSDKQASVIGMLKR